MTNGHEQRASEGNWLYDAIDENHREFFTVSYIPDGKAEYHECTQAEREEWEEEHKPAEVVE